MKAYYELPCNDTDLISRQVLSYLNKFTNLLNTKPQTPWNFLNRNEVLNNCPALLEYFKEQKLIPRDISVTVCYENLPLHYDSPPVVAKINFPILNTSNSINFWYTISDEDYATLPWVTDPFGQKHEDISQLPRNKLKLFDKYSGMTNPIVFNSRIPHEVLIVETLVVPRIVLSCTFNNEPLHYLQ